MIRQYLQPDNWSPRMAEKWPSPGFIPCEEHGCNRARVVSMEALRMLKPKNTGSICPKCGIRTVTKEDVKDTKK